MPAPQTGFGLVTPTQNSDGSACVVGEVTDYIAQITPQGGAQTNYDFKAPATWVPGSAQNITFASMTPPFVPVAGTSYTADVEAADGLGVSVPSGSVTWVQGSPAPLQPKAPTALTVH